MDQLEGFEDQLFILIDDSASIKEIKNLEHKIQEFVNHHSESKQYPKYQQLLELIKKHKQTFSILSEYKPYLYIVLCIMMYCCLHSVSYDSYKYPFITTIFLSAIFVLLLNESLIEFKNRHIPKPLSVTSLITSNNIDSTCCICLDELNVNKYTKNVLTNCGHYFHYKCLRSWVYNDCICPMCRTSLI